MDKKKSLLENLRELTPSFKYEREEDELEDLSVRAIAEPEEDEEESLDSQSLDDEEHSDHEEEDEEGEDVDGDGDEDNVHALSKLTNAFESSPEEVQHALIMFTRIMIDTNVDIDTLQQFIDDVDEGEEEDEEDYEDDGEGFDNEDDMYGQEDEEGEESTEEDEEESNESVSEEDEEYSEFKNELYESLADVEQFESNRGTYFTNESIVADDYDMFDLMD